MLLIIFISLVLGAFFKAIADTLVHHFETSIFAGKKDSVFWNPALVAQAKPLPLTNYPFTAWHLANSLMIAAFLLPALKLAGVGFGWRALAYLAAGTAFVLVFNWFYNKILRK